MKACALTLLFIALPAHAGSEAWLDAYGGKATDETARLDLNQDLLFGPDTTEGARFDPDLHPLAGLRARVDVEKLPFGIGLDFGYARVHHPQADLTLIPIAMGVTLPSRLTLARSAQLGSLHPVGMLGLVVTAVDGSASIGSISSEVNDNTWGGGNGRIGVQASLGLSWQPTPGFAVFTEYRYQQLRFHLEHTNDLVLATQYLQTTGKFESQAVMLGVSFRLMSQPDLPTSSLPMPMPAPATEATPEPAPDEATREPAAAGAAQGSH